MAAEDVPHVLMFPVPAQGHVPPMLDLAYLLSHVGGLYVTFLNTPHIHARLSANPNGPLDRFARIPRFRFRTISDGLPEDDPRPPIKVVDIMISICSSECSKQCYRKLLLHKKDEDNDDDDDDDGWPRVTCVVADGFLPLAFDVAEGMNIPVMILRTSSACSIWAYYNIPKLIDSGEVPFPEVDDHGLDKAVQSVAGMKSFLRRRDLPSFMRQAKSTEDATLRFMMTMSANLTRARALILNTFESLDAPVLSLLRSISPTVYTLGPIHNLAKLMTARSDINNPKIQAASFWQEDHTCLKWLDSQAPKSVVYVSFGSITVMSREDLLEIWHGLANSGHRFLWVVRSDLVHEGVSTESDQTTPPELEEATKARGRLVSWAPQEDVLAHPAIGCFLTHSGWNSTLESIVAGVPMICWPFFADQLTTSRYVSEVWKIGVDMKDMHGRDIVEKMVRDVMDIEGVEELRKRVGKLAEMAEESIKKGGSSYQNLECLIYYIKSLKTEK